MTIRITRLWALVALCLIGATTHSVIGAEHRLIVGWDDAVIVCGPGTEAGMDSPESIKRTVKRWKARGYRGVYWRVDEAMLPKRFMSRWDLPQRPATEYLMQRVDHTLEKFPVLKTLLEAAEHEGVAVWAWYPTIYSGGAPATAAGASFKYPWLYENKFATDHPEVLTVDRAGNKQYMVWEYAYPEARKAKVSEFVQFAKDYGFKRFVACLRTEAAQNQAAPKHADQFGFNAPVVAEMKQRHGIDILKDPRFDFAQPQFKLDDAMVENWRKLRGGYLTQFYRELRVALTAVDPQIEIAVQIPGDRAGTCLGNWPLEWRTWIDEGLINEIVVPVVLDGYEGYGSTEKAQAAGYLQGTITPETVTAFVKQSRHPEVRVIQAGGPATSPIKPPQADGWRLDAWPDLWMSNMAERWEQWQRDLADFGHIKFVEQSFDEVANESAGIGDFCYRPELRAAPGFWEVLGDGRNGNVKPFAQSKVRRGDKGQAMQVTRAADGSANLSVRHFSRHDRRNYPFPGDTAICSGSCELDFWVRRADAKAALVVYLADDVDAKHANDIGLFIPQGETSTVYFRDGGKFVASSASVPANQWVQVRVQVDLERRVYGIEITGEQAAQQKATLVCRDVKYESEFNAFNKIDFAPQGETGSVFFLDDVAWRWTPSVSFERAGKVLVQDGFEDEALGKQWSLSATMMGDSADAKAKALDISTDSDISYGREYRSLRLRGSGGRATLRHPALTHVSTAPLVIDIDVLPKSDLGYLQIPPSDLAGGSDDIGLMLFANDRSKPLLELHTRGGHWQHGSGGTLTDSKQRVAFDAWQHLQLVLDRQSKTYRVLLQVIAEPPRELCRGELKSLPHDDAMLAFELSCERPQSRPDGPAFDNLRVMKKE